MTTFKEAQRVQSQKAARSKRFNRVPTEDQEQMTLMIQRLEEQGYMCKVCFGADEAIDEIKKYLMI